MIRRILGAMLVATSVMIYVAAVLAVALAAVHASADACAPLSVLRVEGPIECAGGGLASGSVSLPALLSELRKIERSAEARALVLRVDSPGGTPAASDELHRAVRRVRESGKKVVVSMGDVCASGGYYVACAGDLIFANAATVTGSIGVITEFPVVEGIARKIGVEMQTVKSGEFKDLGTMYRLPTAPERAHLQSVVDELHRGFVAIVARSRGRTTEEISLVADGRYFTGEHAAKIGLVDRIGGLREAIDEAKALAGLPADEEPAEIGGETGLLGGLLTMSVRSLGDRLLAAPARFRPRL